MQESAPRPRLSPHAVCSLILGILGIVGLWLLGSIPAIVLGIVALGRIKAPGSGLRGRGVAIAGIVTGAIGVFAGAAALMFVALAFPAATGAMQRAHRVSAENTAYNLKNAMSSYFTEYRRYPDVGESGDSLTDPAFMGIVMGENRSANPRGIAFYTDRPAKRRKGKLANGLSVEADGSAALWDPWGNPYHVRIDADYDNRVTDPRAPGEALPESILVWSAGPDGDPETWDDNVTTW